MTSHKIYYYSKRKELLYRFISMMPGRTKQLLELFNITFIVILIIQYITHVGGFVAVNHLLYRVVIATFVSNVLLLKKV